MPRKESNLPALGQINFALQGGGAHGAFTWGVLDRLLEEPELEIEGISACSAGAINACLLVSGYEKNGAQQAKIVLAEFWQKISHLSLFSPFQRGFWDKMFGPWSLDFSPFFFPFDIATRMFSPYVNFSIHKYLQQLLEESIDFTQVSNSRIKLFITNTDVQTGLGKSFTNTDISPEILLGSISIPTFFPATLFENEKFWDGSYSGNPPLHPLVNQCTSKKIILVRSTPSERKDVPMRTADILYRINEIAFNTAITKELEFIRLLKKNKSLRGEAALWSKAEVHHISSKKLSELPYSSKLNLEKEFILMLFDEGRKQAESFISGQED